MKASTLAITAIPSAALAILAALLFAGLVEPPVPRLSSGGSGGVGGGGGVEVVGEDADTQDDSDARVDAGSPVRRPVRVRSGTGRMSLDPKLTAGLSSPDSAVRERTALALLERGTEILDALHYVQPKSKEGAVLLSKLEIALDTLRRIERGSDYSRLDDETRLGLRLKYWGEVLPASALVGLRRHYWQRRVATNTQRIEIGGITADEAAFDELELARSRLEAGEATQEEWRAARERLVPAAARHLSAVGSNKATPLDVRDELAERLRRLDIE